MAYRYQFIPADGAGWGPDGRAEVRLSPETRVTARVPRLAPTASAIAAAIDELYRDIEDLRRSIPEDPAGLDGRTTGVRPIA